MKWGREATRPGFVGGSARPSWTRREVGSTTAEGACGVRAGRAVVGVVVWSCRDHGSGWSEVLAKG